jgi:hypothetical protein
VPDLEGLARLGCMRWGAFREAFLGEEPGGAVKRTKEGLRRPKGFFAESLISLITESLILAQDERWRRA